MEITVSIRASTRRTWGFLVPGNEDDLHLLFQESTLIRVPFGASPGQRRRNVLAFFDSRAHPTEGRHSFSAEESEAMECWCGIAGGSCVHLAHLAHSLRYPCGSSRDRNCRWRTDSTLLPDSWCWYPPPRQPNLRSQTLHQQNHPGIWSRSFMQERDPRRVPDIKASR